MHCGNGGLRLVATAVKRQEMRVSIIRLGVLIFLAAGVLIAWALATRGEDPHQLDSEIPRLYSAAQDAIVSLEVHTEVASGTFIKNAGKWYFANQPLIPVNPDRWGGVVLLLSGPNAERFLLPSPDPGKYGLDDPSAIVQINTVEQGSIKILLGDKTPDGRQYYARVQGQASTALINAPWGDVLARLATEPPFPYWFFRVPSELVRVLEIGHEGHTTTLLLGLDTTGARPSARVLTAGVARDLDNEERILAHALAGGPSQLTTVPWPKDANREDLGLDPPHSIIRLSYELPIPLDNKSVFSTVYEIGRNTKDGTRFVFTSDSPALLKFDQGWVNDAIALANRLTPK